jgi:hypothetical protein
MSKTYHEMMIEQRDQKVSAQRQMWKLLRLSCNIAMWLVVLLAVNLTKDWIVLLFK